MNVFYNFLKFRLLSNCIFKKRGNGIHSLYRTQGVKKSFIFPSYASSLSEFGWHCFHQRRLFSKINEVLVSSQANRVELQIPHWPKPINLSYIWLRDHCRCSECYNQSTCQREIDVRDIPLHLKPASMTYDDKNLYITWPDGHTSKYDFKFLWQSTYEGQKSSISNWEPIPWTRLSFPATELITVPMGNFFNSHKGKAKLMESILKFGLGIVSEVIPSTEKTQEVAEAICPIMSTFYGKMWIVKADMNLSDTAYSNQYLGPHTDGTYFTEAPRIQVFHCLKPADEGGETLLVDGLSVAMQLREKDPDSYEFLSSVPTPSEYIGDGQHFLSLDLVFKHHPVKKTLSQFRYNIHDRAPLSSIPVQQVHQYYHHLQKLMSAVRRPSNEMQLSLQPGFVLFIDNWRVMHGRNQFKGPRTLTGCYLGNCDFTSQVRVFGFSFD